MTNEASRLRWTAALVLSAAVVVGANAQTANPPAPGFEAANSDARAIEIADRVMETMGGRAKWDAAQCIGWTIFGRTHLWNKWTGDYRLESDTTLVLVNLNTMQGRAWRKGQEVTDEAEMANILSEARSIWINDFYWLAMPYKLKDSGVTLRYGGESRTEDGREAFILVLTFRDVGDTPENKYEVFVDKETGLVTQWSYYKSATDAEPRFTLPWTDWKPFGGIMLATGRGKVEVTGIRVDDGDERASFERP